MIPVFHLLQYFGYEFMHDSGTFICTVYIGVIVMGFGGMVWYSR